MCEVRKMKHLQENDEEIENVRETGNEIKLYRFNDQTFCDGAALYRL